jgi:lipopolysaccharide biosynthesis regulator YciM
MDAKTELIHLKVSKAEKTLVKKAADEAGSTISAYVRAKACACGTDGYDGIFRSVTWTCPKCGRSNTWKRK